MKLMKCYFRCTFAKIKKMKKVTKYFPPEEFNNQWGKTLMELNEQIHIKHMQVYVKRYSSESYKNKQQEQIQSACFHYIKNNFFELKISLVTKPWLNRSFLQIWSHFMKKHLIGNFTFCAVLWTMMLLIY